MTILTTFTLRQIFGISLTRGKEFIKYQPKGFDSEENTGIDE